jgi:hypothetical protein
MLRSELHTKLWSDNIQGKDLLADRGVDGRLKLKWIFKKSGVRVLGLGQGLVPASCEDGNEPSDSIKEKKFLE